MFLNFKLAVQVTQLQALKVRLTIQIGRITKEQQPKLVCVAMPMR